MNRLHGTVPELIFGTEAQEKLQPLWSLYCWDCRGITTVQWCRAVYAVMGWPIPKVEERMMVVREQGVAFMLRGPLEVVGTLCRELNARRVLASVAEDL